MLRGGDLGWFVLKDRIPAFALGPVRWARAGSGQGRGEGARTSQEAGTPSAKAGRVGTQGAPTPWQIRE